MPAFLDDRAVAERVLHHIEHQTTDLGTEVWREPVENYTSQTRLDEEIRLVMRRTPTPFCPSAALSEAGSYIAREVAGTPVVVVRGADGKIRAFRNACRHRGMQLADGTGCLRAFECRYHGWTYNLDGQLRHIPHEDGFPDLDKDDHGLVPIAAVEKLGLVFLTQDDAAPGPLPWEEMSDLIAPDQQLMHSSDEEVEANWKVFLEGFLEGYHIKSTHPETFLPYGFDNLNIVETCGRNGRITYPFQRIMKLAEIAPENRRIDGLVTYVYHLFPNALFTVLSHHTNLVILEPVSLSRTRFISYGLTNSGSDMETAQRDATFVGDTAAKEDRAVVCAIQRSIDSGANEHFTFGHFEGLIAHFHRSMAAALAEAKFD